MIYDYLGSLKTAEICYSDESPPKHIKYKDIKDLDDKPFLAFARTDFSDFKDFKNFFKRAGSLYLRSFLEYLFSAIAIISDSGLELEYNADDIYYNINENTPESVKEFYVNQYEMLREIKEINKAKDFEQIYNSLLSDLGLYLKECKPIGLESIAELHDFLYGKQEEFFDYNSVLFYSTNRDPYRYKNLLVDEFQEELKDYINIMDGKIYKHSAWDTKKLFSYLKKINLEFDFDKGFISGLKISNPTINTLLVLELLHYYINKEEVGQCAHCGKSIIVRPKQKPYHDKGKPIYCYDQIYRGISRCQVLARDGRGNKRKKKNR
ncbi:hypothetical protein ACFLQQ_03695, partial [Actinomycetota bacterium]